ncbi:GNAT family N-acetyltransferase [Corynebacterium callunae]|uniref:GNAT family N-acetyltransferase n=1 Tax=Corynebacterium callunae TaxID=1721 RepID=UPI003981ECD7
MVERDFLIRPIREGDFPQVREIYELGLETGHASYETSGPTWEQFSSTKIMDTVLVAVEKDDPDFILGWVSAAPISTRQVFHGVVEDSIYIHPQGQGRGVGGTLLSTLIELCESRGMWAIHSWIFPENEGSAKLHASRGFQKVGTMHQMARMTYGELEGQWRDCDLWERLLATPE